MGKLVLIVVAISIAAHYRSPNRTRLDRTRLTSMTDGFGLLTGYSGVTFYHFQLPSEQLSARRRAPHRERRVFLSWKRAKSPFAYFAIRFIPQTRMRFFDT
jgi:hypothetical protein